jgi:hypothetical protein
MIALDALIVERLPGGGKNGNPVADVEPHEIVRSMTRFLVSRIFSTPATVGVGALVWCVEGSWAA